MGLFSVLFACSPRAEKLPDIIQSGEEGWYDLAFLITAYTRGKDNIQTFDFAGLHQGKKVALRATLSPDWTERLPDKQLPLTTYKGIVTLLSLGSESDALVSTIDALYKTNLGLRKFKQKSVFTGISLGGDPRHPEKGEVKIKLFYEPADESQYAELYFNVLFGKKTIQIHEKDPDYRSSVVKAFGEN
jgi:hypothetical protein